MYGPGRSRRGRDAISHLTSVGVLPQGLTAPTLGEAGLRASVHNVLTATASAAELTTLELQARGAPEVATLVRRRAAGLQRTLELWTTVVQSCSWHEGLLLVATAATATSSRRRAVGDAGSIVGELLVADRRRAHAEMLATRAIELAGLDALTQLGNRRTWRRALDEESSRAGRYERCTSIMVVDLDGLKRINDELGHAAGDAHLQRASAAVRAASRSVDVVCRLGGDEFGVLAPETPVEGATRLATRLREELARAGVEASIGVATTGGGDLEGAWHQADAAMYCQKRGRAAV